MAINTQKLLPSTKGGALVKFNAGRISSPLSIQKKSIDVNKLALLSQKRNEQNVSIIQKSLINVDTLLKSVLTEDQQKERTEKQIRDQEEAEKRETKLEAPKETKKFKLPGVSLPGMGFLDRIKRFLFFTALGWLFNRFQKELPRLVGIVKVIMPIYGVIENIFKFILESTVNFIDGAYETYDKFRGLVKTIGGENAQAEFDNLSGKLNEYINYVLIGGMALTGAISTFAKNAKNYKPPKPPTPKPPAPPRGPVQGALRTAQASAIRASRSIIGKQATKQILRTIKGPLSRIPLVGGLIEFGLSWALGDSPGKAAFRGVGSTLLGGVGMAIGAFPPLLPFGGPLIGSFLGGWAGAELGGLLYDVLFQNKKPSTPVQQKRGGGRIIKRYAKGGQVIGQGGRTLTIQGNKNKFAAAQTTQPGKDVGGKKKIRKLYPDPSYKMSIAEWNLAGGAGKYSDYEKQWEAQKDKPNPYQALTEIADIFKEIPYGVGGLMGGAIDAALGQKLSESTLLNINSGLESLFETFSSATNNIKSGVSQGILGVQGQISTMQSGGAIPRTSGFGVQSKDIDPIKVIGTSIKQKVNNALREVQNQIAISTKKKMTTPPGKTPPGTTPPFTSPTPGTQQLPTGKNGRYTKAELTYIGKMNPTEPKVKFDNDWYGRDIYLKPAAADAFKAAQKEAGPKIGWILNSGYRSLEHQQALIDAGYPAAPLGTSDHGDGIALDVQEGTNGHTWLVNNGGKFGWRWPAIKGDLVHFYYDGSYVPKGKPTPVPEIFKPEPKTSIPPIFQLPGQQPKPQPKPSGKVRSGQASWYGPGFEGNETSAGEIFRTSKLTAAIQSNLRDEYGGLNHKSQIGRAHV
jgi:LAS superfamily LD-carboxypeptidase LdcB